MNNDGHQQSLDNTYDYDEAFELTGYGFINYLALFGCSMIFVYCSQEMSGIAYVITPAECDLHLDVRKKSLINSGIFIGIVLSSACWGSISDRYGRKTVIIPAMIASMFFSIVSSLSTNFWMMFVLRLITGILVSASTSTVLVYLGELHSSKFRNRALSIAITSDQINFVLFPGIAWLVIPGRWSFSIGPLVIRSWRVFMWLWALTGIMGTVLLYILPESPKYLMATKGSIETVAVLTKMFSWNMKKEAEEYPVKLLRMNRTSLLNMKAFGWRTYKKNLLVLFKKPLRRCFIITHYCMFIVNLLSNGLYMWMPALINEMLKKYSEDNNICGLINFKYFQYSDDHTPDFDFVFDARQWSPHVPHDDIPRHDTSSCADSGVIAATYLFSMLMELVYLGPYIVVIIFISKYSPNKIYAIIMLICAITLAICCILPQVTLATLSLVVGLCSGSCVSVLSAMVVDTFPTKLRALSMSTMFLVGQFGTIAGIFILSLMNGFACYIVFCLIAAAVFVSVIAITLCWPDCDVIRQEMEQNNFSY